MKQFSHILFDNNINYRLNEGPQGNAGDVLSDTRENTRNLPDDLHPINYRPLTSIFEIIRNGRTI